ncbi:hypothetical protein ACLOJK_028611, partial [Asimina triloba]
NQVISDSSISSSIFFITGDVFSTPTGSRSSNIGMFRSRIRRDPISSSSRSASDQSI